MIDRMIAPLLLALPLAACDVPANGLDPGAAPAPDNYSHYIVYIADGTWDPADPSYDPVTAEELQHGVWGLSADETQQLEADAKAFFVERFGVDVDDPGNAGRINFAFALADPRAGYRVVTMANRAVPPEGWPVWDGAWVATVIDPAGFELGGEFTGVTAPVAASVTYGRYQIETGGAPLVIGFSSLTPFTVDAFGNSSVRCALSSEEFGAGEATAMFALSQTSAGDFTLIASNVLTFR